MIDHTIRYFFTSAIPYHQSLFIMTQFIFEGTKILIRYQYAILKVHKLTLKQFKDPVKFEASFNEFTLKNTPWLDLNLQAFKYKLTTN